MNKIRFVAVFLFVAVFVMVFSSCEKTRREGLSDEIYDLGVAAVEIADDYLDGRITIESAYERICKNSSKQYNRPDKVLEENDSSVRWGTAFLELSMEEKKNGTGTDDKIRSARNALSEELWH